MERPLVYPGPRPLSGYSELYIHLLISFLDAWQMRRRLFTLQVRTSSPGRTGMRCPCADGGAPHLTLAMGLYTLSLLEGPGHPPPEKPQDMEQVAQVEGKGEVTCNLSSRTHTSALRSSPSPEKTPASVFAVLT